MKKKGRYHLNLQLSNVIQNVLELLLPSLIQLEDSVFGSSFIEALNASLPSGWDLVQAAAVGYRSVTNLELINILIDKSFQENLPESDKEKHRRYLIALSEAIKRDAGNSIVLILLNLPIINITQNQLSIIFSLISKIVNQAQDDRPISADLPLKLVNWIMPVANLYPTEVIPILDYLALLEIQIKQLLEQLLEQSIPLLNQQQLNLVIKRLQNIPPSLETYLLSTTNSKESRLALVIFYKQQAENVHFRRS